MLFLTEITHRGVGRTEPRARTFADYAEGVAFRQLLQDDPLVNISADAVARMHARYSILSNLAEENASDSAKHISTALIARDMLSIVYAHGRDKLLYWGLSYVLCIILRRSVDHEAAAAMGLRWAQRQYPFVAYNYQLLNNLSIQFCFDVSGMLY